MCYNLYGDSMTFSHITWTIFFILVIIYLIVMICYRFFFAKIVGWFGEHWVKKALKALPSDKYIILNDIMLDSNGYTHQIDHMVLSQYGIFVIESKQYNGYITGNKYDKKWVRHISRKKKIYYENPIRQNYGHVKTICELLSIDEGKVFNIVCIPSTAKLKIENDGELTRYDTLTEKIQSHKEILIPDYSDYLSAIVKNNIVDRRKRKEHNKYARNVKDFYDDKCPKCGGDLVKRSGQYGEFYGCSNYPKCKYTKKIK